MGQQCSNCGGQEEEGNIKLDIQQQQMPEYGEKEIQSALKIQSNIRGKQARKNIRQGNMMKDKLVQDDALEYQQEQIDGDGTVYRGQTNKQTKEKHGYGLQAWPDGAYYEGNWQDGMQSGQGKYTHKDGDVYEGNWLNNKAHGYGVYNHANGSVYEGEWLEDNQEGFGREVWNDGSSYTGNYNKSTKQGYGHYYWQDGNTYMGNWNQNQIDGQGIFVWADKRIYSGDWHNGKIHGVGSYLYTDKRFYHGDYQNDKKQGYGCYIYGDGRAYLGQWQNGKQNGEGHLVLPNGVMKKGTWTNGQKGQLIECQQDEKEAIFSKLKEIKQIAENLPEEVLKAKADMRRMKLDKIKSYSQEQAMLEERQDQPQFTARTDASISSFKPPVVFNGNQSQNDQEQVLDQELDNTHHNEADQQNQILQENQVQKND